MQVQKRLVLTWVLAAALAASGPAATPSAMSKEQMHEQMIAIAAQLTELNAGGKVNDGYACLKARYRELSDALGGDDPGRVLGSRRPPGRQSPAQAAAGSPFVPLGCLATTTSFANPASFPITDFATTTSTIEISGIQALTWDVNVTTNIAHSWPGDLDITLTSVQGSVVTLSTGNGDGNDDVFDGTVWDDHAGDVNPPGAVTDAVFEDQIVESPLVPEEAMGAVWGEAVSGPWTMEIFDGAVGDAGWLHGWSLEITSVYSPSFSLTLPFWNDTSAPITDLATTTSTIEITDHGLPISRVKVHTDVTHTWSSDLDITLTSPSGTVVTLTTDNGGGNDDVFYATWWDDHAGPWNPPGPVTDTVFENQVYEGWLVPEEALGAFQGEIANGVWTLEIHDDAPGDTGTLHAWELSIRFETCACPGEGSCNAVNGSPGCEHSWCCLDVCLIDPSCCAAGWDSACADLAACVCMYNDECDGALSVYEGVTPFNTSCASTGGPPLPPSCDEGYGLTFDNDVWWIYQASCTGELIVSLCDSDFDTRLAVYHDGDESCPGALVACNDDACGGNGLQSEVTFPTTAGEYYLIRVGGFADSGTGTMTITCQPAGMCPWDCQTTPDGQVSVLVFLAMLAQWGQVGTSCDYDGGGVSVTDFLELLANWGACP
jgi:subtilisin-like proprotein convertase family protein